jgi:hypothetical protein
LSVRNERVIKVAKELEANVKQAVQYLGCKSLSEGLIMREQHTRRRVMMADPNFILPSLFYPPPPHHRRSRIKYFFTTKRLVPH